MYAVVGCSGCSALWIVEGRPESTSCPRCETRHQYGKLKQFVTTDDENHAREVRASILANRSGHGEAFAAVDDFETLENDLETAGVSAEEYLEAAGIDPNTVADAGERASETGGSLSRRERVKEAVRELDQPRADDVVAYCESHGVGADYARDVLDRLARSGEVTENGGVYRAL